MKLKDLLLTNIEVKGYAFGHILFLLHKNFLDDKNIKKEAIFYENGKTNCGF